MGKLSLHHIPVFGYKPSGISCSAADEATQKLAIARMVNEMDYLIEIWNMNHWFHEQTLLPVKSVEAMLWFYGRLFSAGLHGDIVEHDLHSGGIKCSESAMSGGAIWCMALNKKQRMIAAGTETGSVMLFEIHEGVRFAKSFVKHEGRITSIAWYDPLNVVVTGGLDNIRVWNANTGNPIQRIMIPRQNRGKETIIWALEVFGVGDEMTIVTGDSTGKTTFWAGPPEQYTSCKCMQSHHSDVLAIGVRSDGQCVVSSGADSKLVRFELASLHPGSSDKQWAMSSTPSQHQGDVNTLECVNDNVISAGLDGRIIIKNYNKRKTTIVSPIPQKSLVHMAYDARCMLTQYPTHLELWKLADTNETSDVHGTLLPISSPKKLLLKLDAKDKMIVCSAVSKCGKWVCYSDSRTVRLYHFAVEEAERAAGNLITPVAITGCPKEPAHCFAFSPDSKSLVISLRDGTLQSVQLKDKQATITKTKELAQNEFGPIYLMSFNSTGSILAVAELMHGIHLFNMKKLKMVATFPKYAGQPTAMSFHPKSDSLIVSYSDRTIVESDAMGALTKWGRKMIENKNHSWQSRPNVVRRIFYHPRQPEIIFVQDDESFTLIDKREPLPERSVSVFQRASVKNETAEKEKRGVKRHAFHHSENKYLIHLDFMKDDALVAVERLPVDLVESLAPSFKKHKFGV